MWHAGDIGTIEVTDTIKISNPRAVYGNVDGKELRAEFPLDHKFEVGCQRMDDPY